MAEGQASAAELEESTVLMIGEGEPLAAGVQEALQRRGLTVLTAPLVGSTQAAIAMAPDLILLVGDAAADGGHEVLGRLAGAPLAAVLPVVILADDAALDDRLRAFRFGAAAVVARSASVDAIAKNIALLVSEIPQRSSRTSGELGDTTLDDFVGVLSRELRAGILSVKPKGARKDDTIRIVLGEGRSVADVVEQFVAKVRPLVQEAEVVRYEFHEKPGGTIHLLGAEDESAASDEADIRQMRVLLADDDIARADAVAQQLRERGANVVMTDLAGSRIERARDLDPGVLIIGEEELRGAGYQLVRRMREDTRLRWAFLLVVRWDEIWSARDPAPVVERIVNKLHALADTERTLKARAVEGEPFDTRLEVIGPARLLRALSHGKGMFRATVHNRRALVRVDFAEGLIAGAVAELREEDKKLYGPAALAALLSVATGKVHVEPVTSPSAANIMATVDGALSTAEAEEPPLRPSTIVQEPPEGQRVAMARFTPAQPMKALGKNIPAGTRPGLVAPKIRPAEATRTGIQAPADPAAKRLPPKPKMMPPTPKVTLKGAAGAKPAWKPPPPAGATDPTLENPAPPPGASVETTEPTVLPEALPKPEQTVPDVQVLPPRKRPRRNPTLVGMPAPEIADPKTGPVQNPPRGGVDATHDRIEPPTDVVQLPPDMMTGAGRASSIPPIDGTVPIENERVSYDEVVVGGAAAPKAADATMPLRAEDLEYPQVAAPAPPAPPEIASPLGVPAPVVQQAQPTMPLTTEDIEYSQLAPPATPELARKQKASKAATWILAAGIGGVVLVALVIVGWLVTSGDDAAPIEVASDSTVETVEVTETETETADAEEAEEAEEVEPERRPTKAAAGSVPGRPVRAEVDLPRVTPRARRMPAAQREREALRHRIRGARALRRGQWPLAQRMYRQSLVYEPESAEAHKGHAVALYRRRQYRDAVAWMRRAIELDGSQADWYVLLGDGYRELDDRRSAREAWQRAAEVDPQNEAARSRLR